MLSEAEAERVMDITKPKLAAAAFLLVYAAVLFATVDVHPFILARHVFLLLFPLALIWFPEEIGGITGIHYGLVNKETPGCFVAFGGWLLLVGYPLLAWWFRWFEPVS